eukprot:CCRYP_007061-RA/>CCRYP_007061-RA protein AED:0.02 eAED:0.02 QI:85/1/1/1/0/0/2/965/484
MKWSATAKGHVKMRRHIAAICMPLIEWVCVAGIPTMICTSLVGGLPMWTHRCSLPMHGDFANTSDSTDCRASPCSSLQWLMPLLILASLLTLATVSIYGSDNFDTTKVKGDTQIDQSMQSNGCNKHENGNPKFTPQITKPRDVGVVMGSHLIPLLYMSINIFNCKTTCINSDHSSEISPDRIDCLLGDMHQYYQDTGFLHSKLASLGGLAFAASNLYLRFQYRKFNSNRAQNRAVGCFAMPRSNHKADGRQSTQSEKQRNVPPTQLVSKIFLGFLIADFLISEMLTTPQQQNRKSCFSVSIGLLHMFLISCHPGLSPSLKRPQYAAWPNCFTPGEWMVVSTVVTTSLSEFFVLHIFHIRPIDLPDHIVIAHAGLSGCIFGAILVSFFRKAMKERFDLYIGLATSFQKCQASIILSHRESEYSCTGLFRSLYAFRYRLLLHHGQQNPRKETLHAQPKRPQFRTASFLQSQQKETAALSLQESTSI